MRQVENSEIARLFETLADLLEIAGENPFRVRAYRNAARVIANDSRSMAQMVAEGEDLTRLSGIGKDLAGKITNIVESGHLPLLEQVEKKVPETLSRLTHIRGLGPKRVATLYQQLDIRSLADLRKALAEGKVAALSGFGPKTEAAIRAGLERLAGSERRTLLFAAEPVANKLVDFLRAIEGVKKVTVAGSYRRRREDVGDLDILITARRGTPVIERFVEGFEGIGEVGAQGQRRATCYLRGGMQVDLRVVPQVSYGAALHYFTGSKAHNIAVRRLGVAQGLKINEYGVFRDKERIAGRSEKSLYRAVGLPWIAPELREDRGEIDAAHEGALPELVTLEALRGDLHLHTDATDGQESLEAMVEAAHARGYEYVAITDHSRRLQMVNGLTPERLEAQMRAMDRLQKRYDNLAILKGCEVDILEDGRLDLPDALLEQLDVVICAVHTAFQLPESTQTERILRAMDNPRCHILAHPSGRLLGKRAGYAVDMERVIEGAAERGCCLELNAQPRRLDLTDHDCRLAKARGVPVAINSDAHATGQLAHLRFGVDQARRGWLEKGDVLNSRPLKRLRKLLRR